MAQRPISHRRTSPRRISRLRLVRGAAATAAAAVALVLTGCALQPATSFVPAVAAGSIHKVDLPADASVTVTSKNFTEQLILGKIAVLAAKAAGFHVNDMTNAPGSVAARQLVLSGGADLTFEYTGTAWITYLGHPTGIPDKTKQYESVRDADARNGLSWLEPAPLNNTYALAVREEASPKLKNISTLSELAALPAKDRTFCVESEFNSRTDGFAPMLKHYGLELSSPTGVPRSNVSVLDAGTVYTATDRGTCNFGEVYTTDGRIDSLGLKVLKDDKHFFPAYNVSPVLSSSTLKKYPQLKSIFAKITPKLTDSEMRDLNRKVDVDGQEPANIAFAWMHDNGFINRP